MFGMFISNDVKITDDMITKSADFTKDSLKLTYNRYNLNKSDRIKHIIMGKLGELVFHRYLYLNGIEYDESKLFTLTNGKKEYPDDFITSINETIDIKTAYLDYQSRIMVPCGKDGQWDQMPKHYYVGIKIHNMSTDNKVVE